MPLMPATMTSTLLLPLPKVIVSSAAAAVADDDDDDAKE